MTAAALTTFLSALLFLAHTGNAVVSEASEVVGSVMTEDSLNNSVEEESSVHNVSKKPILQPKVPPPQVGTYILKTQQGRVCVKASLGVQFTVMKKKKKLFFDLDPKTVSVTGYCEDQKAVFSLGFDGGNLEFTFTRLLQEGNVSYVNRLRTTLEAAPTCKTCKNNVYTGIMDNMKLFKAKKNHSFKCKSDTSLILANNLRLKFVPLQIQAFDLVGGLFGKEAPCMMDYIKLIVPIILGAAAVGIGLIALLVFVMTRDRRGSYEPL